VLKHLVSKSKEYVGDKTYKLNYVCSPAMERGQIVFVGQMEEAGGTLMKPMILDLVLAGSNRANPCGG